MKRLTWCATALLLSACAGVDAPDTPDVTLSAQQLRDYTRTLSSDGFEGRGPGQPGGDAAVEYIADRFREFGLEPVNGSYFQSVPMIGYTTDPATARLSFRSGGGTLNAAYLDDFVANAGDPEAESMEGSGEVVFVGYGIDAPETDWDDFADIDVRGKVLLILVNDPPAPVDEPDLFGGRAMTYYGRWTYKFEEAARQGALGALVVHETEPASYPWNVVRGGWSGEQFSLPPDPAGPDPAGMVGWVSRETAVRLLALGGLDFDALKSAAGRRGFVAVPTGVTASASLTATVRQVDTRNVVGLLRGSERPDEVVTLTAHHDHFGIGEAVNGDSIYNGAYDNASGVSLLMEIARNLAALPYRPDRSLLFLSTAAEEAGLLGTQWYVQDPLIPLNRTVAEINLDGINLWGETEDVSVLGEERSGLGAFVRRRAEELGLEVVPESNPEAGTFFRSDHFPMARAGVPSLNFEHGWRFRGRPEGWGQEVRENYVANLYHTPDDEFSEDFVFEGAVQEGTLALRTAWDIANSDAWPEWHDGQEFKAARDAMMEGAPGN